MHSELKAEHERLREEHRRLLEDHTLLKEKLDRFNKVSLCNAFWNVIAFTFFYRLKKVHWTGERYRKHLYSSDNTRKRRAFRPGAIAMMKPVNDIHALSAWGTHKGNIAREVYNLVHSFGKITLVFLQSE